MTRGSLHRWANLPIAKKRFRHIYGSWITQNRRARVSEGHGSRENRLRAQQSARVPIDTARFGGTFSSVPLDQSVHGRKLSQQQEVEDEDSIQASRDVGVCPVCRDRRSREWTRRGYRDTLSELL